jgi:tetratricopeptide (TPR) repeat protein
VWVTDFGLARHDAGASLTLSGDLVGTARYMSPEQARGGRVDERSDVYSLGATLYELVALRSIFEGKSREATLMQVLQERPAPLRRLDPAIPRPLSTIVGKALEKEPEHRYQAAAELAEDLRRYLGDEPLIAQPPTAWDQLRRGVRRHKTVSALLGLLLLCLVTFGAGMTVLYGRSEANRVRAEQAEQRAQREADAAGQVAASLIDMLSGLDPSRVTQPGGSRIDAVAADVMLDRIAEIITAVLQGQPELQAGLVSRLSRVLTERGRYEEAADVLQAALDVQRAEHGEAHADVANLMYALGHVRSAAGDYRRAEPLYVGALAIHRDLADVEGEALDLMGLAGVCRFEGDLDRAEALFRQALELAGADWEWAITKSLADLQRSRGDLDAARELYVDALHHDGAGGSVTQSAAATRALADIYRIGRDLNAAEDLLRELLDELRVRLGPHHPEFVRTALDLARVLENRAHQLGRREDLGAAEELLREALESRRSLGTSRLVISAITRLGSVRARLGFPNDGERLYREALDLSRRAYSGDYAFLAHMLETLAWHLAGQGRHDEAAHLRREAIDMLRRLYGDGNARVARSVRALGMQAHLAGDLMGAETHYREALLMYRAVVEQDDEDVGAVLLTLAHVILARHNAAAATALMADARSLHQLSQTLPADHPHRSGAKLLVGVLHLAEGKPESAEPYLRECLAIRREQLSPGHRLIAYAESVLGECMVALGEYEDAERLLLDSHAVISTGWGDGNLYTELARQRLVKLYEAWGRPDLASSWRASPASGR